MARGSLRALVRLVEIAMQIKVDPSAIGQTRWYEYTIRFLFGGLITAVAGVIATKFGPVVDGLFLAFPAILPASATLIEKHEKQKNDARGLPGEQRGREAASIDAAGSAMGSVGLLVFALLVWQLAPGHSTWTVLIGATVAWLTGSVLIWHVRNRG